MEEEEENLGAGGFASTPNVGGEGTSISQPGTGTGKSFAIRPCFFFFPALGPGLASPPSSASRFLLGGDLLGLRRGILGDILDDGVYILRIH